MAASTLMQRSGEWELLCKCAAPEPDAARLAEILRRPLDWQAVLALAQEHGVLPLLRRALIHSGQMGAAPAEVRQSLDESRRAHSFFTLTMTAELFRLSDRFSAAGIDAVVVKGPVLAAQAFGDPTLRQFSDLDLLVRHRDVLRAAQVMQDAGFAAEISLGAAAVGKIPGQFLFTRAASHAIVELHTERTLRYFPRPLPLELFFARRAPVPLDGRMVPALSSEDTLVFICVHGSKHFWERLMWIADVAALVTRHSALDWPQAFAVARETGTTRMVHLGLLLATDVFAIHLPKAVLAEVRADTTAARLAGEILKALPAGENASGGALRRAIGRMQMCGGVARSTGYLLRLAFAPTEEDWGPDGRSQKRGWMESLRRPLRLARKYRNSTQAQSSASSNPIAKPTDPTAERKKARA